MATGRFLDNKLAIVTGASRGIGVAISENLASKGANLILNFTSSSSKQRTQDLADELVKKHNIKAIPVQASLGEPDSGKLIVDAAKEHFSQGDKLQIDVIINNAGLSVNKPLQEVDIPHYEDQYRVNVLGPILLVQAAIPHLPFDRSGRIINVSSVSSSAGLAGQTVYGGTKAALDSMTRTWARELNGRATVNAVNPGPVDTDMWAQAYAAPEFREMVKPLFGITPLAQEDGEKWSEAKSQEWGAVGGRPGQPAEIAGVIGMLTSPESGWCTGSVICANGGMKFST